MDKYLDHRSTHVVCNSKNDDEHDCINVSNNIKKPLIIDYSIDAVLRQDAYWSDVRANSTAYNNGG